jgi:hypothetical protein
MSLDRTVVAAPSHDPVNAENLGCRAGHALQLCCQGDVEAGLQEYREILRDRAAQRLPLALHITLLTKAGLSDAANVLTRWSLRIGADICVSALRGANAQQDRLAEAYEQLFENNFINTIMVANYLKVLSRTGQTATMAPLVDPALVEVYDLTQVDAPWPTVSPEAVAASIIARADDSNWFDRYDGGATHHCHHLNHVHKLQDPAIIALMGAVQYHVDRYLARSASAVHPVLKWRPQPMRFSSWAEIFQDVQGFHRPHIHPGGCFTAVFYAAAPEAAVTSADGAGCLRIGRPDTLPEATPGWPDLTISPIPGRLLLMPSYLTHWTVPIDAPGRRVVVTIDVRDCRYDDEAR